jgi:hypothetical protein
MTNAGEYTQSLIRKTQLLCPMVAGYITGRLRAQDIPAAASGFADHTTLVTLENVGASSFTVQLLGSDDRSATGPRENLGAATTLVVGGRKEISVQPHNKFLEVKSMSGDGQLKMQLDSQIKWDILGFAEDDVFYPTKLWQPSGKLPTITYP